MLKPAFLHNSLVARVFVHNVEDPGLKIPQNATCNLPGQWYNIQARGLARVLLKLGHCVKRKVRLMGEEEASKCKHDSVVKG